MGFSQKYKKKIVVVSKSQKTEQVLIVIPARGGSKGIPRKNLRSLGGLPLIYYSIKNALSLSFPNVDVYVSSDDDEILNVAKKVGAEVFLRKTSLAGDEVTLDSVIYDVYKTITITKEKNYDLIVTLQPTSPLLSVNSIETAICKMLDDVKLDTIISCKKEAHLSWKKSTSGFEPNYKERLNRQYLDPIYLETGGFLITRSSIISENSRIGSNVSLFELEDSKETIDIDTFEDWSICEYHLKKKLIVFVVVGNETVGLGHVYNSTLIANDFVDHEIVFLVEQSSQMAFDFISNLNFKVVKQVSNNIIDDVAKLNPDVVISDILDTSKAYITGLKNLNVTTINFEDLGDGALYADIVFNAIYPEKIKVINHFYGPKYFCARDEFLLSEEKHLRSDVDKILLSFGGVDPAGITPFVLESIYEYCMQNNIEIDIVTGFGFKKLDLLKPYLNTHVRVHTNIKNISDFMLDADIAFTSGGRTTYELALIGTPSIVICQNERELTHFFANEENGFVNLGLSTKVTSEMVLDAFVKLLPYEMRVKSSSLMKLNQIKSGRSNVVNKIKQHLA